LQGHSKAALLRQLLQPKQADHFAFSYSFDLISQPEKDVLCSDMLTIGAKTQSGDHDRNHQAGKQ
jgi:hypothetical protein